MSTIAPCGKLIKACGLWGDVQRGMAERGRSFSLEQFGTSFESDSGLCTKLMRAAVRGGLFETARDIGFGLMGGCRKERDEILMQNREIIDLVIDLQEGDTFLDGSKDPVRSETDASEWAVEYQGDQFGARRPGSH